MKRYVLNHELNRHETEVGIVFFFFPIVMYPIENENVGWELIGPLDGCGLLLL